MLEQQQQIYKVAGVDESAPAMDLRKRKAIEEDEVGEPFWSAAPRPREHLR